LDIWRLLKLETHDAFMNMAIDEAILKARIEKRVPNTLRLYKWRPSAVSVGKFQKIENEVQIDNCRKCGIDLVRRITGGGTVYHAAGDEITYSVVVNKRDLAGSDATAVYAKVYAGLSEALGILGACSDFKEGSGKACPNLTIRGRKISGSAQCHKGGFVLQHGTLLVDVNLERMFDFLRVPWAETSLEAVCAAKGKITSIDAELGKCVSVEEVQQATIEGFRKRLQIDFESGSLTSYECELSEKLRRLKYATDDWTFHAKGYNEK
jgi:lipoate-protein ligase A